MILFPPAKINLGLRVTGKRQDGFHNIESIFYPVPMCDVLEFTASDRFRLTVEGRKVPGNIDENILTRTWQLMRRYYQVGPVEAVLLKNIPVGSGLGGGSSDAAFFLKGLGKFFNLHLSENEYRKLALQLGSDVPFFLSATPALVRGRGEVVSPVTLGLRGFWVVIVFPETSFSTAGMFSQVRAEKAGISLKEIVQLPINQWQELLKNDFEKVAFEREPALAGIKSRLLASGALYASLTGTGSALYGLYDKEPKTEAVAAPGCEIFKYRMQ